MVYAKIVIHILSSLKIDKVVVQINVQTNKNYSKMDNVSYANPMREHNKMVKHVGQIYVPM